MTHQFLFARAALIVTGLILAGCSTVSVSGSYGSSSGFSRIGVGLSNGYHTGYSDDGAYPSSVLLANPYAPRDRAHRHSHQSHPIAGNRFAQRQGPPIGVGTRDWRDGDGDFRRDLRRRDGTPLADRVRLGRQERIREQRQDRIDAAIEERSRGVVIEGTEPRGFGERLDTGEARRLDRSTQVERANQQRALKVRQKLLARQREARQGTSLGD